MKSANPRPEPELSGQYKVAAAPARALAARAIDTVSGKQGGKATMAVGAMIPVSLQ